MDVHRHKSLPLRQPVLGDMIANMRTARAAPADNQQLHEEETMIRRLGITAVAATSLIGYSAAV